ncbi:glycosyltransferase family 1 protein [Backusella circina FSU 941]|nr:glycosyltransferase family 1 protein [Backusella circina FSU 941]
MLQLIKALEPKQYQPRIYMMADSDILSEEKAIEHESTLTEGIFELYKIPRARQVGQPWKSVPWTVFLALLTSLKVMMNTFPDLIICNGPGSCVPICLLAYLPRIFGIKKIEIIYIESFARVNSLSLTGKLLYRFVDRFLVQWPELNRLDRAEYKGILV